jgi:hypothetical protein
MTATLDAAAAERRKLRRVLGRLDTVFFLISAMVPPDIPGEPDPTTQEVRPVIALTSCPECRAPADITDRFSLQSTDGPVEHIAVSCVAGHHFRMAADRLPEPGRAALAVPVPGSLTGLAPARRWPARGPERTAAAAARRLR